MNPTIPCPTAERLGRVIYGEMAGPDEFDVTEHLSSCVVCQRRMEEQASGGQVDPRVLRELSLDDRPPHDSAFWPVMNSLRHNSTANTVAHSGDTMTEESSVMAFLQPASRPGILGQFGEYEIIRVLGRGGMGIVFEAIDPWLERHVALKVLDPKFASDDIARQRFCREARSAAAVTHENVVIIHSVNEHSVSDVGDLPYLVMQYVAGETLQTRLDRGQASIAEVVSMGRQVAAGLAAAHRRGLIHRDVKPANVLISHDECLRGGDPNNIIALSAMQHVKLTDFGLARAAEDVRITQTGFTPGTPQYMSPEQARGEEVDQRTDLFSLGGVLYAMATGRAPFEGSTPYMVLRQVTDATPAPVRSLNPDVPDWLAVIIEKLLAKRPEDRFESAAEVAGLLFEGEARLLFCPVNGVKLPSQLERVTESMKPRRAGGFVLSAGIAGLVLGAGIVWPLAHQGPTHLPIPTPAVAEIPVLTGAIWSVAFSPDGQIIAMTSEDGTVRLFNHADGSVIGTINEHRGPVWSVAFSPDGSRFITAGDDGFVRQWRTTTREMIKDHSHDSAVRSVQYIGDGSAYVASLRSGVVKVWDATTLEPRLTTKGHDGVAHAAVISLDGSTIASAGTDSVIRVWNTETGEERFPLSGHTGPVYSLALSPDGTLLASAGWDRSIRVWDVKKATQIELFAEHDDDVWGVTFSPDGKRIASAGQDKTVKVWDVATGKRIATYNATGVLHTVRFSPDGKQIAAAGRAGTIQIWNAP